MVTRLKIISVCSKVVSDMEEYKHLGDVKATISEEETRDLRSRIMECLGNGMNDADLIFKDISSDSRFFRIVTIGRVKLVCKEAKSDQLKTMKVVDEETLTYQRSIIDAQDSLPLWPKDRPVLDSLYRDDGVATAYSMFTFEETMQRFHTSSVKKKFDPNLKFRESLLSVAKYYDNGDLLMYLRDEMQSSGILLVTHSTRIQTNGAPLFCVEWYHNSKPNNSDYNTMFRILQQKYKGSRDRTVDLDTQQIWLTELRRTLNRGFKCGHKLLQMSCIICPISRKVCHEDFKIPCSIDSKICGHCQGRGTFSCSRCLGIQYCSKDCQKLNWKVHKNVCNMNPLEEKDTVLIPVISPVLNSKYPLSFLTSFTDPGHLSIQYVNVAAKNPYGISRFVIKCQRHIGPLERSRTQSILIYDKERLFHRELEASEQPAHSIIHNIIYTKGHPGIEGPKGIKLYFYARREGSYFRIYTSDVPDQKMHLNVW